MEKLSNNRIQYLDTLRVISCMLVIIIHSTIPYYDKFESDLGLTILLLVSNVSSKLFFMISGALLLPVKRNDKDFIIHRLKAIVPPLIVWSIVYLGYQIFTQQYTPDIIKRKFLSIFFTPVEGDLWFLYAMIGIYLIMPIISRCLQALSRRQVEYGLGLWLLASFIPYVNGLFLPPDTIHGMFSPFATFIGYVILGYYLRNYPRPLFSRKYILPFAAIFIALVILLPIATFHINAGYIDFYATLAIITHDIGINTIVIGITIFSLIQHLYRNKQKRTLLDRTISQLSILSFGIYLCHILTYRAIVWQFAPQLDQLPPVTAALLSALACLAITATAIRLIYLIPFSKYIIGH